MERSAALRVQDAGLTGLHLSSLAALLTRAVSSPSSAPVLQAAAKDRKSFKSQEKAITDPQILAGEWRAGEVSASAFNSFFQSEN